MKTRSFRLRHPTAFSLVEVMLALGVVSFCLLSIVGLLPTALRSVKNANAEAAAANALTQIADSLRNATTTNATSYTAGGAFSDISWNLGAASNTLIKYLALDGQPTNSASARFVAQIDLVPPSDLHSVGRARVSIAWPAVSTCSNNVWSKADGSLCSGLQFLPKP